MPTPRSLALLTLVTAVSTCLGLSAALAEGSGSADDGRVYRLDFSVTRGDGTAPGDRKVLSLNVADKQHGQVNVGRNVVLPSSSGSSGSSASRADIGTRIIVDVASTGSGDEVKLHVKFQESGLTGNAAGPGAIYKVAGEGDVTIKPGPPSVALQLEDGGQKIVVNVGQARLR